MEDLLLNILLLYPEGISEFDLLQELIQKGKLEKEKLSDTYSLFQTHFLLFHTLYKLRQKLKQEGKFDLEIHCLKIQLVAQNFGTEGLALHSSGDPLEAYYLNLENYNTSPEEVEQILNDFWKLFLNYQSRESALEVLGLQDPVDNQTILKRYRELIKENHPDLGGDGKKISELQRAKENLIRFDGLGK